MIIKELVEMAQRGDENAMAKVLQLYAPLVNRYSRIESKIDEDLRQFILLRMITAIHNFKY